MGKEKKEIGIETLIELLNEYNDNKEGTRIGFIKTVHIDGVSTPYELGKSDLLRWEDKIISKKFGWIGWLVENDKIDLEKLLNNQKEYFILQVGNDNYNSENYFVDGLLMLLSISDTPIEDLISYLK